MTVIGITVVLLLAAGATILGAADLRKANLEIRQVLAAGTAYRHLERALALESPPQWTVWSTGDTGLGANAAGIDGLFAAAVQHELKPAAYDPAAQTEARTIVALHAQYTTVGNRYLALMAAGNGKGAALLQKRQLQPLYLALSSRLSADADGEPSLVQWHLGRVLQVSEVMWVGTGGVLAAILLLLGVVVVVTVRQRRAVLRLHAEYVMRSADAQIDPASGLFAERPFQLELEREVARGSRSHAALSVALIDIDRLQPDQPAVSEHDQERLLREFAGFLSGRRVEDRSFRLSNGQFALILPGTGARQVYPLLDHLRTAAEEALYPSPLSIGIADLATAGADSADQLRQRAEAALREAHRQGGNTVVAFAVKPRPSTSTA